MRKRMKKESNNKGEERVCVCVFTIQNMKIMIENERMLSTSLIAKQIIRG